MSTSGAPGLVISMRSSKISTMGPAPVTKKSWWISALATSSRTASSGNLGTVLLSACSITSLEGSRLFMNPIKSSKPDA